MPDPIRWKSKVLLAKIESAYGEDPTPTGAANAILATDVALQPMEGEDLSRNLERPYLGAQEMIPTALRAVLAFSTELVGSGSAGTAPGWGPLARACGLAQAVNAGVSVVYSPVSAAMESVTLYLWIGSTRHKIVGCRGTAEITVNAQGIPVIRWAFTGLFLAPGEASPATPTLTGFQKPQVATKANTPTFTVNGVSLVLRSYGLNLGNQVEPRLLIGKEEIVIVDRAEEIAAVVEAQPLSSFDPFGLAQAGTLVAANLVHGTTAGKITTIAAPTCQVKRLAGYENNQDVLEWPLRLAPLPNAGNDQFSITLT